MAQRSIIKAEFTFQDVLKFEPQKLFSASPQNMEDLVRAQEHNQDFQIAEVVRNFTGLAEIEEKRIDNEIEKKALEELKTIQEKAYSEAFEIGLIEGRKKAFDEAVIEINTRIAELDKLIGSIRDSKSLFLSSNENQLIKMVYYLSTKLAMFEISEKSKEAILAVIRSCVKLTQGEENIKLCISPDQLEFLELLQRDQKREFEFLKGIEFIPQEDIQAGGCIIVTNFSEIDARLEVRIQRLWEEMRDSIPPLRERIEHG